MAEENTTFFRKKRISLYFLVSILVTAITVLGLSNLNINSIILIRDLAIDHLKRYHPETVDLLIHLTWFGGRDDRGESIDDEYYVYTSGGWIIEITVLKSNPEYIIKADYSAMRTEGIVTPTRIIWVGRYMQDRISENNYTIVQ